MILDCDTGVDDTTAIMVAALSSAVELVGVEATVKVVSVPG